MKEDLDGIRDRINHRFDKRTAAEKWPRPWKLGTAHGGNPAFWIVAADGSSVPNIREATEFVIAEINHAREQDTRERMWQGLDRAQDRAITERDALILQLMAALELSASRYHSAIHRGGTAPILAFSFWECESDICKARRATLAAAKAHDGRRDE